MVKGLSTEATQESKSRLRFRFHFIVLCRRKRLPNSGCVDLIYENFAEVKRNYLISKWNNFYFQI